MGVMLGNPNCVGCCDSQRLVPGSDISTGAWEASTGSDLWEMLNDPEGTPDDDTTHAVSKWGDTDLTFNPLDETDPLEVKLVRDDGGTIITPSVDTDHVILYRAKREAGPGVDLVVSLLQASTTIATDSTKVLGTSYVNYTFTLTTSEAANITDYSNLRLNFLATLNNTYAVPNDDIDVGQWVSTPLHEKLDESPTSADDATTEISNDNTGGSTGVARTFKCSLGSISDPGIDDRHVLFSRWHTDGDGRAHMWLFEDGTQKVTEFMSTLSSYGWRVNTGTLSIEDYSLLSVQFRRLGTFGSSDPFYVTSMGLAILARPRVTSCEMTLPA